MPIVYMATNLINGKRYIGVTKKTLAQRATAHWTKARDNSTSRIHAALRKYGRDMFRWSVVTAVHTMHEAYVEEIRLISIMKPEYNVLPGGIGGTTGVPAINRRSVLCLENGLLFLSVKDAAKYFGVTTGVMCHACSGKQRQTKGHHFIYSNVTLADDNRDRLIADLLTKQVRERRRTVTRRLYVPKGGKIMPIRCRRVECIETGAIYESATVAAKVCDVAVSALIELCLGKNGRRTVGGLTFRYLDHGA